MFFLCKDKFWLRSLQCNWFSNCSKQPESTAKFGDEHFAALLSCIISTKIRTPKNFRLNMPQRLSWTIALGILQACLRIFLRAQQFETRMLLRVPFFDNTWLLTLIFFISVDTKVHIPGWPTSGTLPLTIGSSAVLKIMREARSTKRLIFKLKRNRISLFPKKLFLLQTQPRKIGSGWFNFS